MFKSDVSKFCDILLLLQLSLLLIINGEGFVFKILNSIPTKKK
jgi:hypothetical protein